MCKWGTDRVVEIVQRRQVGIDDCIAEEIVRLNLLGVHTINSCCGHGKAPSTAIIWPHSVARAKELGYTVSVPERGEPTIELRGAEHLPDAPSADVPAHLVRNLIAYWDSLDAVASDDPRPTTDFAAEMDRRINALR